VVSVVGKVPPLVIAGNAKAKGALAVTLRNDSGGDFADHVLVSVRASTDNVLDDSDVAVAQLDKVLKIKLGAQAKPVKLKVPLGSLPTGTITLFGVAVAEGLTASSSGPALSVEQPVVHLVGGAGPVTVAKPIKLGKKATLLVPLQNIGNVPTTKTPATYTVIVSSDGTEGGAVFQTSATGKVALKPNASKAQKLAVTFPAGAFSPGTYTIIVKLNSADLNDTNGQTVAVLNASFVDPTILPRI
jgi:hypothetical protein